MSSKFRIAISGKSGCGNSTVSRIVAQRLSFRLINYTFRNMALERGLSFEEMHNLAQQDKSFDIYLDNKQVEMAMEDSCVLGSRLAIWMLKEADLKVYLKASPEVRARRIMKREGGDFDTIFRKTKLRDSRDTERYMAIYNIDNNSYEFADLIIETDSLNQEEIAELIVRQVESRK